MTEAYLNKAKDKAKRAYDLLMEGKLSAEIICLQVGYSDVSTMLWQLREKGFAVDGIWKPGQVPAKAPEAAAQKDGDASSAEDTAQPPETPAFTLFTSEELLAASTNYKERSRLAAKALDAGADEVQVAYALGYKSVAYMKAGMRKRDKAQDGLPEAPPSEPKLMLMNFGPALTAYANSNSTNMQTTAPMTRHRSLAAQVWKGMHIRFVMTDPVPDDDCSLPADHVQAEVLAGEFWNMVDDIVAGGVIPLKVASHTYAIYAEVLRQAAIDMEAAAEVFTSWQGQ